MSSILEIDKPHVENVYNLVLNNFTNALIQYIDNISIADMEKSFPYAEAFAKQHQVLQIPNSTKVYKALEDKHSQIWTTVRNKIVGMKSFNDCKEVLQNLHTFLLDPKYLTLFHEKVHTVFRNEITRAPSREMVFKIRDAYTNMLSANVHWKLSRDLRSDAVTENQKRSFEEAKARIRSLRSTTKFEEDVRTIYKLYFSELSKSQQQQLPVLIEDIKQPFGIQNYYQFVTPILVIFVLCAIYFLFWASTSGSFSTSLSESFRTRSGRSSGSMSNRGRRSSGSMSNRGRRSSGSLSESSSGGILNGIFMNRRTSESI
jgi:hypothetical protein